MEIADNILRERLRNVYFLSGGAYGGKTTMAKLLEQRHGFLRYRQGDHWDDYIAMADPEHQPAMTRDRAADWHGFFAQPPRQYADWMRAELREEAGFLVADLLALPRERRVVVDGIVPLDLLRRISDYGHVFLLFAPDAMKRAHYFERADKDEVCRFILSFPDGEKLLENVIDALNLDNEAERRAFVESGFRYAERSEGDTIEETLALIEEHFGLK